MNETSTVAWTGPPIDVVSLGVGDPDTLPRAARAALARADAVIGSPRHFAMIEPLGIAARRIAYPSPLSDLAGVLDGARGEALVVLASGDALFFGIGRMLHELLGPAALRFHPNISSVQACFHAVGRDWQDTDVVSLHGRPFSDLRRHLSPGALLAVFTDAASHPRAIAAELCAHGWQDASVWVCEAMGTAGETVSRFDAASLAARAAPFDVPNTCIVELTNGGDMPAFPGVPDERFATGAAPGHGMISKREVRLAILSLMQGGRGQVAWDVGAGCGSVSVEWARWHRGGEIHAVESNADRVEHLRVNRARFGVESNCHVVHGEAPRACESLPDPDCVFIGGSAGRLEALLDQAWARLKPGGRLVASAVTDDSRRVLDARRRALASANAECEWTEIAVTRMAGEAERRLAPVTLFKCARPA